MRSNVFSALAVLAFAQSVIAGSEVFEEVVEIPEGWRELSSMEVNKDSTLSMRIHLAQQNVAAFEQKVIDLSTPDHPTYGDHMDTHEIKRMLQPTQQTVTSVLDWLEAAGISQHVAVEHDWINMNVTVAQAEKLLNTKYSYFRDEDAGKTVLRTLSYSLPAELHKHILLVQPTTMFGMRAMRNWIQKIEELPVSLLQANHKKVPPGPSGPVLDVAACNATITPECLQALYNFKGYKATAPKGKNKIGVNGFLEQFAQYEDLRIFLNTTAPSAVGGNFSTQLVNGGINTQDPNIDPNSVAEANLDIQYTVSLSFPTENIFYSTAGRPPFIADLDVTTNDSEPYLDWLQWLLNQKDIPQTITTSYGESEQTVPLSYRKSVCNLFAQLGARGTSVIFSSGDAGAGWSCLSNDGKKTTKFMPTFPGACPFVTSVGGTEFVAPEQAIFFSSGGFSETWDAPDYQQNALKSYFNNNKKSWGPWKDLFVKSGRGFPDVALQASNYRVVLAGKPHLIGGTSASAPAFAGLVGMLNDNRIAHGKKPLGFLNPWLYSDAVAKTFTDITRGRSTGCDGTRFGTTPIEGNPAIVPGAGWDAVVGWDPVTGLGSPNFDALRMASESQY